MSRLGQEASVLRSEAAPGVPYARIGLGELKERGEAPNPKAPLAIDEEGTTRVDPTLRIQDGECATLSDRHEVAVVGRPERLPSGSEGNRSRWVGPGEGIDLVHE